MTIIIAYIIIGFTLLQANILWVRWEYWAIILATIIIHLKAFMLGRKSV